MSLKDQLKYLREAIAIFAEIAEFSEKYLYLDHQVPGSVAYERLDGRIGYKVLKSAYHHADVNHEEKDVKKKKSVDEISKMAKRIEFSDRPLIRVEENDWDGIYGSMDEDERSEFEDQLEEYKDDFANERLDEVFDQENNPSENEEKALENLGFDFSSLKEKISELVEIATDDEDDESTNISDDISDADTDDFETFIADIERIIKKWSNELTDESSSAMSDYVSTIEDEFKEEMEKIEDQIRDEIRNQIKEDYDDHEDRVMLLRDFYRKLEKNEDPRINGGEITNVWQKDEDGDFIYRFKTKAGTSYLIDAVNTTFKDYDVMEISFANKDVEKARDQFSITGSGSAHEVFRHVVPAIVAIIDKESPDTISFTAKGKSRQSLYDKLVKTIAMVLGDYSALAFETKDKEVKRYVVRKRELAGDLKKKIPEIDGVKSEILVFSEEMKPTDVYWISARLKQTK